MTNPPYTARIHRRIDALLIGITIVILLLILYTSAHAASDPRRLSLDPDFLQSVEPGFLPEGEIKI